METPLAWSQAHWFDLVQTAGIVGGFFATYLGLLLGRKSRNIGNYLTLSGQHLELWNSAHRQPELGRVFKTEVNFIEQPISPQEQEFLNLVIVHFHTGWLMAREKIVLTLELLALDAKDFFQLPIPREVWIATRHARDTEFTDFIEKAAQIPHAPSHGANQIG